ncbi:MAG: ATP-binding cassette domain-containing protein [Lachnospiraceae bacterium]|nr:ATP-binding cassette domain-containing protein [Lachnospiraceae bacterium]
MAVIKVQQVNKTYEQKGEVVQALTDINLTIEKGDIYGIIGLSGAGKSTLVRCLNYLEKPTTGQVLVDGVDLGSLSKKELRQKRKEIAMIFQHFHLLMQKNVLENVCFPLYLSGMKKEKARERARELLDMVGLLSKATSYPAQLSGGQKQRVAIARALACNPKILLCDEATSALDPQTTASILELLQGIHDRLGLTVVVITHQMSVVETICNKVAIVSEGRIVEDGMVDAIFSHPKSKEARELLQETHTKGISPKEECSIGA